MEHKSEMSLTRLGVLILLLTVIWVMCSRGEKQLPSRFEDDVVTRIGGHRLSQQKLKLALTIKNSQSEQDVVNATKAYDALLQKNYNMTVDQQLICIVIRDFDNTQSTDRDYTTAHSILRQSYKNYHILYLSEPKDSSVQKIKSYLISNQVLDDRYDFIEASSDKVEALLKASEKCPQNGIILVMENQERFLTSLALKVINSQLLGNVEMTWGTSLYLNDKVGFSFGYSQKIVKDNSYRKYPYAAHDVVAFRNSLLIKSKSALTEYHLLYPLYMPQSFGFTLLEKASSSLYIPQILTLKEKVIELREDRSELEKTVQQLIRKDQSIVPLLNGLDRYK